MYFQIAYKSVLWPYLYNMLIHDEWWVVVGSFEIHLPISDLRKDPKTSRLIFVLLDAVFGGVQFWGSILSISGHPGWHPMDCVFHFIYWKEKAWWETSNPLVEMETLTGTKHKILQFLCLFPLLSIVTCLLHWRFVSVILGPKQCVSWSKTWL
jgi:hypothetical protein